MAAADYPANLPARVKTMQIVVIVQLVIAGAFLGYAFLQRMNAEKATPEPTPWLTYASFAVAVLLLAGHFILPAMFVEARRRRMALDKTPATDPAADANRIWALYVQRLLIATLLLEVAILFMVYAFMVEGYLKDYLDWGGPLLFMGVMCWEFPILANVQAWISEQQKLLAQERRTVGAG